MDEQHPTSQPEQPLSATDQGHVTTSSFIARDQSATTSRKSKKLPLIVIAAVILLCLVSGSTYAIFNRQIPYQTGINNFITAVQKKNKTAADMLESPALQAYGQKTVGTPSFYDACHQAGQLCLPLFESAYLSKASKAYKDYKSSNGTAGKEIVYTLKQSLSGGQAGGQGCSSSSTSTLTIAAIPHGSGWLIDYVNPNVSFSAKLCPKNSQASTNAASPPSSQPTTATTSAPQSKQNTPSTANNSSNPPSPPKPSGTVSVTNDGCYVAAWGSPGMVLTIYVQKPGGGGGQSSYTIPAAGTIEEASGAGNTTETTTGVLYSNGTQVASDSHTVTSNSCPPAS